MLISTVVQRAAVLGAAALLALVLGNLRVLLILRQQVEAAEGEPERLGYSEVTLMLGE